MSNNVFIPHSLPLNCITHVSHKFKLIAVLLDVYVIENFAIYLHFYCISLNYSLPDYLFTCLLLLYRKLWAKERTEQKFNFCRFLLFFEFSRGVARRVWAPHPQKFWTEARGRFKILGGGGAQTLLATPLEFRFGKLFEKLADLDPVVPTFLENNFSKNIRWNNINH